MKQKIRMYGLAILPTLMSLVLVAGPGAGHTLGQVDVSDFMPPIQGGSELIKEVERVKIEGDTIEAATSQDAINAGVKETLAAIGKNPKLTQENPELGAKWVRFPGGAGVLATGSAVYSVVLNPTATRLAQRNAYIIAYTNAKAAMAQQLGGLSSEAKTVLKVVAEQTITSTSEEEDESKTLDENIQQAAQALLRGYVVYSVSEIKSEEDPDVRTVVVSIVSTPKTLTTITRRGGSLSVANMSAGIQSTLDELKQGIVPPVGGRVVSVAGTGESAFIAYGSAIVVDSSSVAAKARQRLKSTKIAALRARDALNGILNGDKTIWASGVSSMATTGFEQSKNYQNLDPLKNNKVEETLTNFKKTFSNSDKFVEEVKSIRKGLLPSGLQEKSWINKEGTWAFSMVVYYPAISSQAKTFADKMKNTRIIVPTTQSEQPAIKQKSLPSKPGKVIDNSVEPLKGGRVQSDGDM